MSRRRQALAAGDTSTLAFPLLLLLLLIVSLQCHGCAAQQQYENNAQTNCSGNNGSSVLGYTCNATAASSPPCTAYLIFRSAPPLYSSALSVSYLLNSTPTAVADASGIATVTQVVDRELILAPVPCSCTAGGYYQHNASYTIQFLGETYFIIANNTYQGLSTCQALIAQNPSHQSRNLVEGNNLTVPLRCVCPSPGQASAGVKYLLSYLVMWGDDVTTIAKRFRVEHQSVLDANQLTSGSIIYPFTTLLIPLKSAPTPDMLASPAPPPAPPPAAPAAPGSSGSGKWVGVGLGVGCGVLALVAVLGLLLWLHRRRRGAGDGDRPGKVVMDVPSSMEYGALASGKQTTSSSTSSGRGPLMASHVRGAVESLTVYKYAELEKATAGFSEERKIVGSSVYRAVINGDAAAVKRVSGDVSDEVGILKRVNHSSLVRLSGLCVHSGDTYLVFEFAENGALSNWLHGGNTGPYRSGGILGWKHRVQVAFDVADGLNYLHNFTNPPCVHKNIKSSNVLLDADFRAKVSSFSLARTVTAAEGGAQLTHHVVGTQGYLAPEYLEHGLITSKMDVFAFGVILLELLSGKEAAFVGGDGGKRGETLLWESAEGLDDGQDGRSKMRAFMDPRLQGDYPFDLAFAMVTLALRCVAREPRARPAMDEVFVSLSAVYNSTLDWDPSDYGNSGSSIIGR